MADKESRKISQSTVVVPEFIEYPETRINLTGLQQGARVKVKVQVLDRDNNDLMPETIYVTKLTEYPTDPNMEVLGVVRISFNESVKVPV